MTTIGHVRGCRPDTMLTFATDLATRTDTFSTEIERSNRDIDTAMNNWHGAAATAASARALSDELAANHLGQTLITIADHYNTYGTELSGYRTALLTAVADATRAGMTVDDQGNVTAPKVFSGTDSNRPIVAIMLQQAIDAQATDLQTRLKNLLTQFGDAETKAAQAITTDLETLAGYEQKPDGAPLRGQVRDILDGKAQLPTDPKALHDFWETLSPAEKDALWRHDQYLGNRDGLPAVDRDRFNRMKLDDEISRALAGDPAVKDKLKDLQAVQSTLGDKKDRMLMLLDTQSGAMTHAAVAVGNPDTAKNVSVTAGGLNTTVGESLGSMVDESGKIRDQAQLQLRMTPGRDEKVATIAWIGADLPQAQPNADKVAGYLDVATDDMAKAGAPKLASFYDGLGAAHDGNMHLTAVGHSYGSLMTGLALQQPGQHPVDDLVVYGSPGLDVPVTGHHTGPMLGTVYDSIGARYDVSKLGIPPGHLYEMTAHADPVAHFNAFGPSPANLPGFTHLETGNATTVDGVHREEATGHSEYPRMGSDGKLRTSGWNTAMIVAGLPQDAVIEKPVNPIEAGARYAREGFEWLGKKVFE
ncbi:alpha/beta hydrolase [Nocardia sp. NPDC051570]|uniref:alpha/beta hydrolase n=1 Tax=Nocardia sp. NPDC051570 TaxID=3364324 RepID=UPI0037BC2E74